MEDALDTKRAPEAAIINGASLKKYNIFHEVKKDILIFFFNFLDVQIVKVKGMGRVEWSFVPSGGGNQSVKRKFVNLQ